jgi:hypothetical protein
VQEHLRIGAGAEPVPSLDQLFAERAIVVDFPVHHQDEASILTLDRLLPTLDVWTFERLIRILPFYVELN